MGCRRLLAMFGVVLLLSMSAGSARAGLVLTPTAVGSYTVSPRLSFSSPYTFDWNSEIPSVGTGKGVVTPYYYRSYAVFHVGSLPGTVTSLTLSGRIDSLRRGLDGPGDTFYLSLMVGILGVSVPVSDLTASWPYGGSGEQGAAGYGIWQDLGAGPSYGGFTVDNGTIATDLPPPDLFPTYGPNFSVTLNAAAIAAAGGGGDLVLSFVDYGYVNTSPLGELDDLALSIETTPLTVAPEPSTLISGGLAILLGAGYAWRRRRAKVAA